MKKVQKKSIVKKVKIIVKKKAVIKPKTIYKQLEILNPEELSFLKTTVALTVDYSIKVIEDQKAVIKQLESLLVVPNIQGEYLESIRKDLEEYREAITSNYTKTEMMKSISNKLKCFEGII